VSRKSKPSVVAVDLFCGVGGLTHGLALGGIQVKAGIDLDPACRFPYEANNRASFLEADVSDITAADLSKHLLGGDFSLLAGCAPCQSFSTYSRSGRSKKRELDWTLVASFGELISEARPDFVTMENVPQLADHEVFSDFLACLEGYAVTWSVIECSMLGIPQSRRRLVLLASRHQSSMPFDLTVTSPRAQVTVRQAIGTLPPIAAGARSTNDPMHTASSLSDLNLRRIRASKPGGTWRDWDPKLRATCHTKESGSTYPSVYGRMEWDRVAPTVTTQCFGYGNGRFGHPEQDRAISLREAAMLQTFPKDYAFVPDGQPVRFNQLGRLIGNAVPVRLGEEIAESLFAHVTGISRAG
jgi:DNA (cytosine-5)-methyltransferase 1